MKFNQLVEDIVPNCQCEESLHGDHGCPFSGIKTLKTQYGPFNICNTCLEHGHMQDDEGNSFPSKVGTGYSQQSLDATGSTPPNFEARGTETNYMKETFNNVVKQLCESLADQPIFVHERSNAYNKFHRIKNAKLISSSTMEVHLENGQIFPLSLTEPNHNYKLILNDGTLTDAQSIAKIFGLLQPDQVVSEATKDAAGLANYYFRNCKDHYNADQETIWKRLRGYANEYDPDISDDDITRATRRVLKKVKFTMNPGKAKAPRQAPTKIDKWKQSIAQAHKEKGHRTKKLMTKIDPAWFKIGMDPERAASAAASQGPAVHDSKNFGRMEHFVNLIMNYLHGNKLGDWDPHTPGWSTWQAWVSKHYNAISKMTDKEFLNKFKIVPESVLTEMRQVVEAWETGFPYKVEAVHNEQVIDAKVIRNARDLETYRNWIQQRTQEGCNLQKKQIPMLGEAKKVKKPYMPGAKNEYYFGSDKGEREVSWEHQPDQVLTPKMKFDDKKEANKYAKHMKKKYKKVNVEDVQIERVLGSKSVTGTDRWCSDCGEPIGNQHSPYCSWTGGVADEATEDINWPIVRSRQDTPNRLLDRGMNRAVRWFDRKTGGTGRDYDSNI